MAKELRLLNQVNVASPCPADWNEMKGDDRVRHCSSCRLNVYNLSDMSGQEAEAFLQSQTGRVCVRYYQRADGKVMTKDCPKGLKALRQKMAKRLALAASFALSAIGCGTHGDKIRESMGLGIFEQDNVVVGKMPVTGAIAAPLPTKTMPVYKGKECPPIPVTKGKANSVIGQVPAQEPSIRMGEIAIK